MKKINKKKETKRLAKQLRLVSKQNSNGFSFNGFFEEVEFLSKTVLDFADSQFLFQKEHKTEIYAEKAEEFLYLSGYPCSFVEDDQFGIKKVSEPILESLEFFTSEYLYSKLSKIIDKKIPNINVLPYGESFFQKIPNSNFSVWNSGETRAFGKEIELARLKKRLIYLYPLICIYSRIFSEQFAGCTFRELPKQKFIDVEKIIISDRSVASNINFNTFVKDVNSYLQPFAIIKKERKKVLKKMSKILFSSTPVYDIFLLENIQKFWKADWDQTI